MTIVAAQSSLTQPYGELAVPLARYAKIIEFKENAFWGVNNPDDEQPGCAKILTKPQRDTMEKYLAEAQDEIEQIVRYKFIPTYFEDERQNYAYPVQTKWGKVIEAGIQTTSNIELGAVVDHTSDPAIITVTTTVINIDEIIVYHPGSTNIIIPSAINISGGTATISIPRCRMVKESLVDNPEEGLDYSNTLTNFEQTVDVKRVYTNPSTNATLVWPHHCGASCLANGCSEYTQDACMYIRNAEIGSIDTWPASYTGGEWKRALTSCCAGKPKIIRLNNRLK